MSNKQKDHPRRQHHRDAHRPAKGIVHRQPDGSKVIWADQSQQPQQHDRKVAQN